MLWMGMALVHVLWIPAKENKDDAVLAVHFLRRFIYRLLYLQQGGVLLKGVHTVESVKEG